MGKTVLDDVERQKAPGQFVELSQGKVHYDLAGPDDAEALVFVCGMVTPYYVWDPVFDFFKHKGYRVLRYDLYGRGFTDRPRTTYSVDLYEKQLAELVEALSIKKPFNLCGLSMGGLISIVFTDRHPEMIKKLCLIAPYGYYHKTPLLGKIIQTPLIGELMMKMIGDKVLIGNTVKDFYNPDNFPEVQNKFKVQLQYDGFHHAFLSTLRHTFNFDQFPFFERVGKREDLPKILFWGKQDNTLNFDYHRQLLQHMPGIEFHEVDQAGHVPHLEQPDMINTCLLDFLHR